MNATSTSPAIQRPTVLADPAPGKIGAQVLVESLIAEGVDTIFGLPGGVILSIYEAIEDHPQLNHILVRHEQGAVHMAEGYAKTTGKVGVAMATSGPGATNTVTAIADAYYDSVPLVVITGNVPSSLLGNDAFQEADIVAMTRACTKHNVLVRHVDDLQQAMKEAFHVASTGRPGPVLVDVPKDVLLASPTQILPYADVAIDLPGYRPHESRWTPQQLDEVLDLLMSAQRPVFHCGGGVANADVGPLVTRLAEHFDVPMTLTLMGLGSVAMNHRNNLGFSGMHGHYWTNIAIAKADLLFVIGSRLNDRQTGKADRFARNATIVHIDLDPTTLNKNVACSMAVQGPLEDILDALISRIEARQLAPVTRHGWWEEIAAMRSRRPTPNYQPGPGMPITPQWAIERLFHWMPQDAIVATEVGQHQMWTAQRFNLNLNRSWVTSGGLGTMGFGFPAAIGAQAAHPNRMVLDIAGDGSFQMTLQELATAASHGLPVKVAIINNGYLGMVRQWQDKLFNRKSAVSLTNPDYVKLAEAYGCAGFCVERLEDLDATIQAAYAVTDRPVLIDIRVAEQVDVYPWVESGKANEEMLTDPSLQANDADTPAEHPQKTAACA
jgi:acetolactate synthase I/II/III large subunit